jgi:hypothetical protein
MVEFGAGVAIMHAEEPATIPEPQPTKTAETPAVDVSAVAAEEDSPSPAAVPENEEGNADTPAIEPSQVATQPASAGEDQVASSASPGPATLVTPNPVEPPTAQNSRCKRRAKGWPCPVCRQREYLSSRAPRVF